MQKVVIYPSVGEVTLSRTRRSRRISLSVRPDGAVRLSFPVWVTQRRALAFLDGKVEWVKEARRRMAEKYPELYHGVSGPDAHDGTLFGGAENDDAGRNGAAHGGRGEPNAAAAERERARRRATEELRARAKELLPPMVARLAAEHGFRHGAVRVKATRSRWGSCTVRNDINLSISLAALPTHLAEYIVLHELCHTVHKNHSARFHALLDSVTGGRSRALNAELRRFRPDTAALSSIDN